MPHDMVHEIGLIGEFISQKMKIQLMQFPKMKIGQLCQIIIYDDENETQKLIITI